MAQNLPWKNILTLVPQVGMGTVVWFGKIEEETLFSQSICRL
jgi:hypothetical protein